MIIIRKMNKPIQLWEYDEITDPNLLEILKKEIKKKESHYKDYFTLSWGSTFKPNGYCGSFAFNGETYSILPKIEGKGDDDWDDVRNLSYLTYMFLKAENIDLKNEDISNAMNRERLSLYDVLIKIFTNKLLPELQKGIHREYVSKRDNVNKIKGRWLVRKHITKNYFNEKIYCEFDEFSENNRLNKLFLYAAKVLKPQSQETRKDLRRIELVLDEVEYEVIDVKKFNYSFHRMNKRFEKSANLALLLLRYLLPNFSGGSKNSFIFLFKMHDVFERFIANILKDLEPELDDREVLIQPPKYDKDNDLNIKPDMVIKKDDRVELIIDTKYKLFTGNPTPGDKYQMYAYGMSYDFQNNRNRSILLLYPEKEGNEQKERDFHLQGNVDESHVDLYVEKINVKTDSKIVGFDQYISDIKDRLKEIIESQINRYKK